MRIAILTFLALALAGRPSDACIRLAAANRLIGWSADGTAALHVRVDAKGQLAHAESHPTRYEGWKHVILVDGGAIVVKRVAVAACEVWERALEVECLR